MLPPLATSNNPALLETAPVKAPLMCPNNSLSRRGSGIALQFTVTNGSRLRPLLLWIARAISSLPVPLSPEINTLLLVSATLRTISNTFRIGSLSPMIWVGDGPAPSRFSSMFSVESRRFSSAFRTISCTSSTWNGFVR